MKYLSRKIMSSILTIIVLTAMVIAWFYIEIEYGSQSLGFYNFEANPALQGTLGILDIVTGVIIIGILIKWGWFKQERSKR